MDKFNILSVHSMVSLAWDEIPSKLVERLSLWNLRFENFNSDKMRLCVIHKINPIVRFT